MYHLFARSDIFLSNFMRQQAMAERMIYNRPIPANRLVSAVADSTNLMYLTAAQRSDEFIKRHRLTPRNTDAGPMGSASLLLDSTKLALTSTNFRPQATRTSTLPCLSVPGVKVLRLISKSITRVSPIVRNFPFSDSKLP